MNEEEKIKNEETVDARSLNGFFIFHSSFFLFPQ